MIETTDFKNGLALIVEGNLYVIVGYQHVKPGKGGAFVRTRLRDVKTKLVIERTFRSGDKFEEANLELKKLQFTYQAAGTYHFMDMNSYEEISITADALGESRKFLKEGMDVMTSWYNHNVIDVTPPFFVNLKVAETEPGVKGDTVKATYKPATLETGAIVQVPIFINPGETIQVDTRTGEYVGRA